ncbi:MAG: asparagine synthase-related protein [Methylocella sp.]
MRLICGMLHLDGRSASEGLLRAMAAQIDVERLRPSLCLWRNGPAGFAVLDFSARGAQASALPELGASTIAADVRLDEPFELGRKLSGDAPVTEDALLLAALERFGPSGLDQVLGDFAFASWNKTTEHLVCARDAFGIRPLAYVHQPGRLFAFASFPKALFGSGIVPKKIDEDALARRMVLTFRADDCLVAGIQRLPPAHFLEVSREGLSLTRYWQLNRTALGTRRSSPTEAARELRRLVDEAVKCRLPGNGEIGAHLSGGLDSSAIAVLAARRLREEGRVLHAYSFLDRPRNDITVEDETEFVQAILEQEGDIDWTPIRPPAGAAPGGQMDADKMTPLRADAPENAVCTRAEEQGVGLVLSGWGGDEGATFNGRGTLAELFLGGHWRALAREVTALKRERGWPASRIFKGEVLSYLLPDQARRLAGAITGRKPNLQTLIGRILSAAARRRLAASGGQELSMAPDGRENRWRLMASPHITERVEVWAQTGARHGLAFAFPLLDRRVVEFSLSLPSALFLRDGFRRRLFRDAMADVLPPKLRLRHQKYQPFPSHMLDLAESKDELLAQVDAYGQNESVRGMIDLAHLRRLVEAFPSPERVREEMRQGDQPAAAVSLIMAAHILEAAAYLEQHGEPGQYLSRS